MYLGVYIPITFSYLSTFHFCKQAFHLIAYWHVVIKILLKLSHFEKYVVIKKKNLLRERKRNSLWKLAIICSSRRVVLVIQTWRKRDEKSILFPVRLMSLHHMPHVHAHRLQHVYSVHQIAIFGRETFQGWWIGYGPSFISLYFPDLEGPLFANFQWGCFNLLCRKF